MLTDRELVDDLLQMQSDIRELRLELIAVRSRISELERKALVSAAQRRELMRELYRLQLAVYGDDVCGRF